MCDRVSDVIRLANITAEEFEEDYAYTTQPVIVTDATKHWKAIQVCYYYYSVLKILSFCAY